MFDGVSVSLILILNIFDTLFCFHCWLWTIRSQLGRLIAVEKISFISNRSSHPDVFLRKGVLKIRKKFTGGHPCRSAISIKLLCNFVEIALRHGCSPVSLLHIFRTPFLKGALEDLRQFLASERPLQNMKNAFYITWKALFVFKIFNFLSWLLGHVGKRLDLKDQFNFKIYDVTTWLTNNCNTNIYQYLKK